MAKKKFTQQFRRKQNFIRRIFFQISTDSQFWERKPDFSIFMNFDSITVSQRRLANT